MGCTGGTGGNGAPIATAKDLNKLSPDKRAKIEKDQTAIQQASDAANYRMTHNGRPPGG